MNDALNRVKKLVLYEFERNICPCPYTTCFALPLLPSTNYIFNKKGYVDFLNMILL